MPFEFSHISFWLEYLVSSSFDMIFLQNPRTILSAPSHLTAKGDSDKNTYIGTRHAWDCDLTKVLSSSPFVCVFFFFGGGGAGEDGTVFHVDVLIG